MKALRMRRLSINITFLVLIVVILVLSLASVDRITMARPEGSATTTTNSKRSGFVSNSNNFVYDESKPIPNISKIILDKAWIDAEILSQKTSLEMDYGLFRGVSVLRSLSTEEKEELFNPRIYGLSQDMNDFSEEQKASFHRSVAIFFLLRGNLGAAHEILLGVTPPEIETAEYAATHPGQTPWARNHPASFTDTSDWIHSILHRMEGPNVGEGNHTGYQNAKYWSLGGPKALQAPAHHPLRDFLARQAPTVAPLCAARMAGSTTSNEKRCSLWNDLAFIELCRMRQEGKLTEEECTQVAKLQQLEICTLLHYELCLATNHTTEQTK